MELSNKESQNRNYHLLDGSFLFVTFLCFQSSALTIFFLKKGIPVAHMLLLPTPFILVMVDPTKALVCCNKQVLYPRSNIKQDRMISLNFEFIEQSYDNLSMPSSPQIGRPQLICFLLLWLTGWGATKNLKNYFSSMKCRGPSPDYRFQRNIIYYTKYIQKLCTLNAQTFAVSK